MLVDRFFWPENTGWGGGGCWHPSYRLTPSRREPFSDTLEQQSVKVESDRKCYNILGGKIRTNKRGTLYPCKGETDLKSPVKTSGELTKSKCFLLPYVSGSYLPMALIKSDLVPKIYRIGFA